MTTETLFRDDAYRSETEATVTSADARGIALDRTVWDTSWLLSEGSIFGRMLHALIGYTERPTEMQLVVYISILIAMFLLMRVARYSPRERLART